MYKRQSLTHSYLDLDVVNNNLSADTDAPILRFEETRNQPFLDGNSSDYFCTIIRFSIQTGNSLPVFIPRIETGQTDVNKTVYKITMTWGTYSTTISVPYSSNDLTAPIPLTPNDVQDLSSTYYFVYNIQNVVEMLNAGFTKAVAELLKLMGYIPPKVPPDPNAAPIPTVIQAFLAATAPFFELDTNTNRLVINVDALFVKSTIGSYTGNIYINTRLYEMLSGLNCTLVTTSGDANYLVNTNSYNPKSYKDEMDVYHTMYQMPQEISSVPMWNPIASIVFCSSMIPVVPTNTSPAKTYSDVWSTNLISTGNNSNLTNIITDFEIPISETNQYRPVIFYSPTAEYRLVDMHSTLNLNRVDITVFWKTHFGEFIPLRLPAGCSAHIKIMFRHRLFNIPE